MALRDATTVDAATRAAIAADVELGLRMDEEAFRGFYSRTSRMLWAYLERLTGDRQLADDLLQESYYRFLRADAPLDGEVHQRRYLFRIATNLARDGYRRRAARPIEDQAGDDLDTTIPSAVRPAEAYDQRLDLNRAMARLRPRERAMLWLAYAQGASHQEIAEVVGLRTGSVKVLLFRARRRVAALLGRREEA